MQTKSESHHPVNIECTVLTCLCFCCPFSPDGTCVGNDRKQQQRVNNRIRRECRDCCVHLIYSVVNSSSACILQHLYTADLNFPLNDIIDFLKLLFYVMERTNRRQLLINSRAVSWQSKDDIWTIVTFHNPSDCYNVSNTPDKCCRLCDIRWTTIFGKILFLFTNVRYGKMCCLSSSYSIDWTQKVFIEIFSTDWLTRCHSR